MKSKQNSGPLPNPRQLFLEWYQSSSPGSALAKKQAAYLSSSLKHTFYRRVLQVGRLGSEDLYIEASLQRGFAMIEAELKNKSILNQIIARFNELPIDSESIDLLILPHLLEFETEPLLLLREAERILKPEGRLIILGFNPWSVHGLTHRFQTQPNFPQDTLIPIPRMLDWLSMLKLEAELDQGFSLSSSDPPNKASPFIGKSMAYIASVYSIRAIKRVQQPILMKPAWTPLPRLLPEQAINNFRCGNMHE